MRMNETQYKNAINCYILAREQLFLKNITDATSQPNHNYIVEIIDTLVAPENDQITCCYGGRNGNG